MALLNATPASAALLRTATGLSVGAAAPAGGPGFGKVLADVSASASTVDVRQGDTLIGLVKAHYRQQGLPVSESQAFRLAHQVAADNGIANPDLILPGQQVDFSRLQLPPLARSASPDSSFTTAENALAGRAWRTATPVPASLQTGDIASPENGDHPVLDQTLSRAVDKGFLPAQELPAVRSRVLALADRFRFSPDDFARLTLMESGGMNPQASNGRCHGIIQFCDGPGRGAASVGYRDNPRAILGMGLLQQLDLVERYFTQVGVAPENGQRKVSLDNLYLSVLMPAARSEKRRDVALDIPGLQASWLHVDRNRQNPITRDSLSAGLYAWTNQLLQGANARASAARQFAQTAPPATPTVAADRP